MIATNKLRFVERTVPMHPIYRIVGPDGKMREGVQTYRVLQQWWQSTHHPDEGEWRDVPLEKA